MQRGVLEVVSPIQEGASRALKPFRDLAGWVGDTLDAKGEVEGLRAERDQLRASAVAGAAARRENAQLKQLLRMNESAGLAAAGPVGARVIGQDPSLWYGQVTINKGTADGVRADQPVVTGEGLIGRVSVASPRAAIVRAHHRPHHERVGARINASGVTGVVRRRGGPAHRAGAATTPRRDDEVRPGQAVVTAGTQSRLGQPEVAVPAEHPDRHRHSRRRAGHRRPGGPRAAVRRPAPPGVRPGAHPRPNRNRPAA